MPNPIKYLRVGKTSYQVDCHVPQGDGSHTPPLITKITKADNGFKVFVDDNILWKHVESPDYEIEYFVETDH